MSHSSKFAKKIRMNKALNSKLSKITCDKGNPKKTSSNLKKNIDKFIIYKKND